MLLITTMCPDLRLIMSGSNAAKNKQKLSRLITVPLSLPSLTAQYRFPVHVSVLSPASVVMVAVCLRMKFPYYVSHVVMASFQDNLAVW